MKNGSLNFIIAQRRGALRDLMREKKIEAYFLCNLSDLFYVTNYPSEGYYGLIGLKDSWLFLPKLLLDQAKESTFGFHCLAGPFWQVFDSIVSKTKLKKLAFDPENIPYQLGVELRKRGFRRVAGLVRRLRTIKDGEELTAIRKACQLAHQGYLYARSRLKPGVREYTISADLEHFFRRRGSAGTAFPTIIAAGPHSAFPHHVTSDYKIRRGDPVVMDLGCIWEGYRSDLTRTVVLGRIYGKFSRIYRLVEKAQKKGISQVRPGVTAQKIDSIARQAIARAGYGRFFIHGTGHGVGIDIHEPPRLAPGSKDRLRAGMVITVEPGIYLPGEFGVRIEDTLLVTPNGCEILTK